MILADLRDFIRLKQRVTLNELMVHFRMDASALQGMLSKWISKGKVKQMNAGGDSCGTSCCKCDSSLTEIYEWVDDSR